MSADVTTSPASSARKGTGTRGFAIAALAVAGAAFLAIAAGGIGKNLVYYWGPTELNGAGDRAIGATIRLGGQVAPGSVVFDPQSSSLRFAVKDASQIVRVHSTGVPPQMFRENIGVVVEGTMTKEGTFESSRLMVSHDNEYRAPKSGATVSAAELMRTTSGLDPEKK